MTQIKDLASAPADVGDDEVAVVDVPSADGETTRKRVVSSLVGGARVLIGGLTKTVAAHITDRLTQDQVDGRVPAASVTDPADSQPRTLLAALGLRLTQSQVDARAADQSRSTFDLGANVYGPTTGETTNFAAFRKKAISTGAHDTARYAHHVQITADGSGVASTAGVATASSADYAGSFAAFKSGWSTSTTPGEIDTLNLSFRQGYGDAALILGNGTLVSGFGAIMEAGISAVDPASNGATVTQSVNVQLGVVNSRDSGYFGLIANRGTGTGGTGAVIKAALGASWTTAFGYEKSTGPVWRLDGTTGRSQHFDADGTNAFGIGNDTSNTTLGVWRNSTKIASIDVNGSLALGAGASNAYAAHIYRPSGGVVQRIQSGSSGSGDILVLSATGTGGVQVGAASNGLVQILQNNGEAARFDATKATVSRPLQIQGYTFATLPSVSTFSGFMVRVSDRNNRLAISDGTNWRFGDNTIAA